MKLKFIDSIRGIAILMVILVHTQQEVSDVDYITKIIAMYCQKGVQLFFIASAYTLCLSASKRNDETLPLIKFGIRRYFRIAPAYYLALIMYFVIPLILSKLKNGQVEVPLKYNFFNIFSNLTFIHGFYPPANNTIVPGGWSIGTEMAFYALFPLLFKIAQLKIDSFKNIIRFIFSGVIFSQICLSILNHFGVSIMNNNFIYFNIINQLPVFLIGIGYFFFKKIYSFELNQVFNLLLFIITTIISLLLWSAENKYSFSFIPIISGISFIFLIELFQKNAFLNPKLLIRIGQVSFSMYLLHFIFAHRITAFLAPKFFIINGTTTLIVFYIFSVLMSFAFALISEKYIEKPGVEFGRKIIKNIDVLVTTASKQ